uniref:K Homology domain-containing protein n=2 Tax=Wuchereria bancrofti TaxID=6293 RepID=A0A1I8ERM6_WUCBA
MILDFDELMLFLPVFNLKLMANDITSDTMDDNKDNEGNPATMQGALSTGQKRSRDERGGPATKKAHVSETEDNMVQVKVLIPSAAVGALIGKGGETMRNLKSESGCRLQMSKNQEVYPGTNERICLVKGKIASVLKVSDVILEKIREKVDNNTPSDIFDHKGMERKNEMKLVVPNTSAGMVIGKSGARIKEIREQTGANIQVYPKAGSQEAKVSQERIITIAAEQDEVLMDALQRVLEKVAADPQHAMATIPDHKDDSFGPASGLLHGMGGGVQGQTIQPFDFSSRSQNAPQFGGAPTVQQNHFGQISHGAAQVWQPNQQRALEATYAAPAKDLYQQNNMAGFKFNPMQGLGNSELLAFLDSLQSTLRTSGFNETSVAEVMQAMQILAKYNIMGLGLGLGVAAMAQMRTNETPSLTSSQGLSQPQRFETTNLAGTAATVDNGDRRFSGGSGGSGAAGGTTGTSSGGGQNDLSKSLSGVGGVLIDVLSQNKQNSSSSSGQNFAASVIKEKIIDNNHIDLEIPDTIVGAILGPRAKTLAEIQHLSGCKVEVHKRGTAAGQGNRLVSLTGDVDCIRNGRMMIDKVINDEQMRRNQQAQNNARGGFR